MTVPPMNPDGCLHLGQVIDGQTCNIEGTLYGYYPSLGANAFFAAFFGLCLMWQLYCGVRYKTWTYMIALGFGCLGEVVGYVGRLLLNNDPFSDTGFEMQICCLIISPAFVTAGIYLTLKHITIIFGEEWSRLRPAWYTYIFITGDIFSLVLQGAGGGIAATAADGSSMLDVGTNLMIAGVVMQVVILAIFACFVVDYTIRSRSRQDRISSEAMTLFHNTYFRCFAGAVLVAYVTIFARCVYRVPELSDGWRSEIMRNEPEFIALEGVMIVIAIGALTVFHPGYCFPALGNTMGRNKRTSKKSFADSDVEMIGSK